MGESETVVGPGVDEIEKTQTCDGIDGKCDHPGHDTQANERGKCHDEDEAKENEGDGNRAVKDRISPISILLQHPVHPFIGKCI